MSTPLFSRFGAAALFASLAFALTGCNGATGLSSDGGAPVDASGPQPDLFGYKQVQVSIGPIDLAAGQETTVCTIFKLPVDVDADIVKIDATLLPGSHHLIFYKSAETTEQTTPFKCELLTDSLTTQVFGGTPKEVPLYIAETQHANALQLPTGVAYHLAAHQMVAIEAHYINASPNPIQGKGTVFLTIAPPGGTWIPADLMFCGSVTPLLKMLGGMGVPPGMSSLPPGFYQPPKGVKVFGLTTHQHRRGTLMTLAKSTGANDPGTILVNGQPWDNEPFITYDDSHLLTFADTEGIRWQCNYDNPDAQTVYFGPSAQSNEMCFYWVYYFPSVGHPISYPDCIR